MKKCKKRVIFSKKRLRREATSLAFTLLSLFNMDIITYVFFEVILGSLGNRSRRSNFKNLHFFIEAIFIDQIRRWINSGVFKLWRKCKKIKGFSCRSLLSINLIKKDYGLWPVLFINYQFYWNLWKSHNNMLSLFLCVFIYKIYKIYNTFKPTLAVMTSFLLNFINCNFMTPNNILSLFMIKFIKFMKKMRKNDHKNN